MLLKLFDDIKNDFFNRLRGGEHLPCPCCGRYSQIYKRTIHRNLVLFMLAMRAAPKDSKGFVDVPELLRSFRAARDFCILKYWGLLEQMPNDNEKIRTSGKYRLTGDALDFLRGILCVAKHVYVFDDKPVEKSIETVSVKDILGEKFDYSKLVA